MSQLILTENAAPATPSAGRVTFYVKTDGKLYQKDDTGTEKLVGNDTAMAVAFAIALG